MKTGDVVRVDDPSYCLFLDGEGGLPVPGDPSEDTKWTVVAIGCVLPVSNECGHQNIPANDMILIAVDHPECVLFTQQRFCTVLSSPTPENITIDIPEGIKRVTIRSPHGVPVTFMPCE